MVEKSGTSRKYLFHNGDMLKLRVSNQDTLLRGRLWHIGDSMIILSGMRPNNVRIADIGSVYKRFSLPSRWGKYILCGGAGIFVIIGVNHLINNEQVFTNDMYIISGSILGLGGITLSLGEKRCRTGPRWHIKILDAEIR
jgi:hypothetical protein